MRIAVTGEQGFIGRNLVRALKQQHVTLMKGNDDGTASELCVHSTPIEEWCSALSDVDVLIHNAAIVGSDVVDLYPDKAHNANVLGTERIVHACNIMNIPVVYIGTTACYDVTLYQYEMMDEDSKQKGHTLYGRQKLEAENHVKFNADRWMVVRPLFCYGGVGDMNSLISKSLYATYTDQQVHMHLDPVKYKDWLHVDDFVDAVLLCINKGLWHEVWNASYMKPITPSEVVEYLGVANHVIWHPETDYMGHHLVSSGKLRAQGWSPKITLGCGLNLAAHEISKNLDAYNPLRYSQEMYGDKQQETR